MLSNLNPYPDHQPSWKHVGILIALIVALVAAGVIAWVMRAEASLKVVLTGAVTDGPLRVEAAGKFPERFLPGVELNYRFSYRTQDPEKPTIQDWTGAIEQLGRSIPSVEFADVVIGRCSIGLCGTVKTKLQQ